MSMFRVQAIPWEAMDLRRGQARLRYNARFHLKPGSTCGLRAFGYDEARADDVHAADAAAEIAGWALPPSLAAGQMCWIRLR